MILYETLEQKLQEIGVPTSDASAGASDAIGDLMAIAQEQRTNLTFGQALEVVKQGSVGMRLPQWSEDVVVRVQKPDEHSKMTAPYLYVESRFGRVPWKETNIELFSHDWEVVN